MPYIEDYCTPEQFKKFKVNVFQKKIEFEKVENTYKTLQNHFFNQIVNLETKDLIDIDKDDVKFNFLKDIKKYTIPNTIQQPDFFNNV